MNDETNDRKFHPGAALPPRESYVILLERLAEALGVERPEAPTATMGQAEMDWPGSWESTWQDRLSEVAGRMGFRADGAWLSVDEVSGSLRPGQPVVGFRRTAQNPAGWVLLLDRLGSKVFRVDLRGDGKDGWVDVRELDRALDVTPGQRLPWMLCEPSVSPADGHDHHGHAELPPLQRLLGLIAPDRADLWSVVLFGLLVGALSLATPLAVQQLVNSVALGGLLQPVIVLALLLLAVLAFSATLSCLQAFVAEIVQRRVFVRVVAELAHRLPRVWLEAFDRQHGPELVNRFFDVVTVQKVGSILLLDGVALVLQTVIGLLVLSFYHPLMLAFSVVLLLGIAGVAVGMGRGAVDTSISESRAKYEVQGWLEEMARHGAELKAASATRFAIDRADALARRYLRARSVHYRIVFRQLVGAYGLQVVANSALLGLGGGLVIAGQLTLGQLVASELIVTAIVSSFAKLGKHLENLYDLLASADKLGTLFDLPLERVDGAPLEGEGGIALAFHDVGFRKGGRTILDGFDLRIEPRERVALVGPSGSGKSTAFDLILGLRSPTVGYVTVDGVDVRELRLETLREQIVRIRGAEVIAGSLEDNVRLGRAYVSREAVREALRKVGLLDLASSLPGGLDTQLTTEGRPLSHGAALRVGLARAIAGRPRMILLDDSLTDVDPTSRRHLLDALLDPAAPWSVVVASTGGEIVERCDRVISLSQPEPPVGDRPVDDPSAAMRGV